MADRSSREASLAEQLDAARHTLLFVPQAAAAYRCLPQPNVCRPFLPLTNQPPLLLPTAAQEQGDLLTAAQAAQAAAAAMLETERRAHREAQGELERQAVGAEGGGSVLGVGGVQAGPCLGCLTGKAGDARRMIVGGPKRRDICSLCW
jgi:hypothetical protein